MLEHIGGGALAYGVTTGLGHLASVAIAPEDQAELQRSLLTARAAGLGDPLPAEVVRGVMVLRLAGFLQGAAGVSPELCAYLAARIDDGWAPLVPDGPYGAAGEIGPLAHLFQTFIGEGQVSEEGRAVPAADALAARGVAPYEPQPKEGIALLNGSPFGTALGIELGDRAAGLVAAATTTAALSIAVTGAGARAASPRLGTLTGDSYARRVQEQLSRLLADEDVWGDLPQPPVSTRVIPQVHGTALRALDALDAVLDERLRGTGDSPVFLTEGDGDGLYPSGAFHAVDVVVALETLANAICHVINLLEKRLHRLLDSRFSQLPDQLTGRPGVQAGVVALHKTVVGLVAEARTLVAPASVHALDTSTGQEDVQSFSLLVAQRVGRLLDALEAALACELVALRQAAHLADGRPAGMELAAIVGALAESIEPIENDRTLSPDVARTRALVAAGRIAPH
jgi:histidine ammonia-lyase